MSRSSRALVVVLAFALWLAGALGVMHQSLHVPGLAKVEQQLVQAQALSRAQAAHGLAGLFGDHTDAECRLYDQLAHGSGTPTVPLVVLPMLLPAATFAWLEGEAVARWIALFDARGPPSAR